MINLALNMINDNVKTNPVGLAINSQKVIEPLCLIDMFTKNQLSEEQFAIYRLHSAVIEYEYKKQFSKESPIKSSHSSQEYKKKIDQLFLNLKKKYPKVTFKEPTDYLTLGKSFYTLLKENDAFLSSSKIIIVSLLSLSILFISKETVENSSMNNTQIISLCSLS